MGIFGAILLFSDVTCSLLGSKKSEDKVNKNIQSSVAAPKKTTAPVNRTPIQAPQKPLQSTGLIFANPNLMTKNNTVATEQGLPSQVVANTTTSAYTVANIPSGLIIAQPKPVIVESQPNIVPMNTEAIQPATPVLQSEPEQPKKVISETKPRRVAKKTISKSKPVATSKKSNQESRVAVKEVATRQDTEVISKPSDSLSKAKNTSVDLFKKLQESIKNGATVHACTTAETAMHSNGC